LHARTAVYHAFNVANAAQGYNLELASAAHASPAGATVYEKCHFGNPIQDRPVFAPKSFMGRPGVTLKI